MDLDEIYKEIVIEIDSMSAIDEETKQSTLNDIKFNQSFEKKRVNKLVNEEKDDTIKNVMLGILKQCEYNDLEKLKSCLSILQTQKYCLFFTSLNYFGTATCNDFPYNKQSMQIFSLLRFHQIIGPIPLSILSKNNKPSKALNNAYASIRDITNPTTYHNVLVIDKKFELIFLSDFEKNVQTKSLDSVIYQAHRKKNYPFNQIKKILNIGESISSNYIMIEKYLDSNRVLDWKEKEMKYNMVFFLTNISAECDDISKIKIIRLPDRIAFSNPIVLNGNDAFEIINYSRNKNNLNYQFQMLCVSIRGLGVVFIGNKREFYKMNVEQINEYCYESIFYLDFFLSNHFSLKDISKLNIDLKKLYNSKLIEYGIFNTCEKPEYKKKFKDAIIKTIKDADNHFEEKLKLNIAEMNI